MTTVEKTLNALTVRCRAKSGSVADLEVLDISAGGCMVVYKGWAADLGERVLTTVHGLGVRPSQLVWVDEGRAGIAFDEPLHAAVYDHLQAKLKGGVLDAPELSVFEKEEAEKEAAVANRRNLY